MPQRSPMWSRETRDVKQFPLFLYLPCISQSVRAWIGGMLSLQSLIQARKQVNVIAQSVIAFSVFGNVTEQLTVCAAPFVRIVT